MTLLFPYVPLTPLGAAGAVATGVNALLVAVELVKFFPFVAVIFTM